MNTHALPPFNVLDHLDKLTTVKGHKDKYECPHCNGTNLSINKTTGAYTCYDGCSNADVREALSPLKGALAKAGRTEKALRPEAFKQWVYTGEKSEKLIRVNRKDTGEGKKKIWQDYWVNGTWVKGGDVDEKIAAEMKSRVALFRHAEVMQAVAEGKTIYWVEGEGKADLLWSLGLAATTTIGGSSAIEEGGDYSYLGDAKIVICPDRDSVGIKYADRVAMLYPQAKWLYAFPESPLWAFVPKDKGVDILDWVADYKLTAEQIEVAVEDVRRNVKFAQPQKGKGFSKSGEVTPVAEVCQEIRGLIDGRLSGSALQAAKILLRQQSGLTEREFWELWKLVESEEFKEDEIDGNAIDVILAAKNSALALEDVLSASTAFSLTRMAKNMALRPELFLVTLLCAVGSLAQNGTKLVIHNGMNWKVTPNLYGAIVAESSQRKSPVLDTVVMRPLSVLSKQAKLDYDGALNDWEERKAEAKRNDDTFTEKEPSREIFYFTNTSGEAILAQVQRCPHRGLLSVSDELAGLIKGQNAYRSGRGSDAEDMLSYYDGKGGLTLRVDGVRNDVETFNFGVIGGIQPNVLKKLLGDMEDSNGNWARFFFVSQPLSAATFPEEYEGYDVSEQLAEYYKRIANFTPQTYQLSPNAKAHFKIYFDHLEKQRIMEPNQALRAVLGKSTGRIGKVALCLHLLEAAEKGEEPGEFVSSRTLKRAAKICKLAIDQIRALYCEFDPTDVLSPMLAKIISKSRSKGSDEAPAPVTAREVYLSSSPEKRKGLGVEKIRKFFQQLADQDYGTVDGVGVNMTFTANPASPPPESFIPVPQAVEAEETIEDNGDIIISYEHSEEDTDETEGVDGLIGQMVQVNPEFLEDGEIIKGEVVGVDYGEKGEEPIATIKIDENGNVFIAPISWLFPLE